MMCISSPAGRRLAVAKAQLDGLDLVPGYTPQQEQKILDEYGEACAAAADELIAQKFHLMEGD